MQQAKPIKKFQIVLLAYLLACGPLSVVLLLLGMKTVTDLEEFNGKVAGHRQPPASGLALQQSRSSDDARAWKRALGLLPIRKGVYRFRTHEEADEWLWQMLTRRP